MTALAVYPDPTELMVQNWPLGVQEYILGSVLLLTYVVLQLIALPLNIVRDSTPVSYKAVRTREEAFLPAYKLGYDFKSEFLHINGLPRIHYLDEGNRDAKETIVLLHGLPFWSFYFMKIIPSLTKAGYRVIAPDFIGFGKSDKFVDYRAYNVSLHKETLAALLYNLNPTGRVTLVGHNWGWMIGAALAKDHPDLFSRFVILNTNNVPDGELTLGRYSDSTTLFRFSVLNSFFLVFNAAMNLLREWFPLSVLVLSLNRNYSLKEVAGFLAPHQSLSECGGTTAFPLMVPVFPDHPEAQEMREVRSFLASTTTPTLVVYSDYSLLPWLSQGDFVVGNRPIFYQLLIDDAEVYRVPDGGHNIMYDRPEIVAPLIIQFINKYGSVV